MVVRSSGTGEQGSTVKGTPMTSRTTPERGPIISTAAWGGTAVSPRQSKLWDEAVAVDPDLSAGLAPGNRPQVRRWSLMGSQSRLSGLGYRGGGAQYSLVGTRDSKFTEVPSGPTNSLKPWGLAGRPQS